MRECHQSGRYLPPAPPAPLVFHIQEPGQTGYHFHYHRKNRPEYVVGRVPRGCGYDKVQIQLRDPRVSRRHCRIFWHVMNGWMIEDLNSANGTTVTLAGILPAHPQQVIRPFPIALGATIRVGRSLLTVSECRNQGQAPSVTAERLPGDAVNDEATLMRLAATVPPAARKGQAGRPTARSNSDHNAEVC